MGKLTAPPSGRPQGKASVSPVEAGPLGREILEAQEDMRRELASVSSRVSLNTAGYSTTTVADQLAQKKFAEVADKLKASDAKLDGFSTRLVALEELGALIVKERETRAAMTGNLPPDAELSSMVARIAGPILTKALAPLTAELRMEVQERGKVLQRELNEKVQAIQELLSVARADSAWGAGWRAGQLSLHMQRTASNSMAPTPTMLQSAGISRNRDEAASTAPGSRSVSRNPDLHPSPPATSRGAPGDVASSPPGSDVGPVSRTASRNPEAYPPSSSPRSTFVRDLAAALRPVAMARAVPSGSPRTGPDPPSLQARAEAQAQAAQAAQRTLVRAPEGREVTLGWMSEHSPEAEVNVDCRIVDGNSTTGGSQFFL